MFASEQTCLGWHFGMRGMRKERNSKRARINEFLFEVNLKGKIKVLGVPNASHYVTTRDSCDTRSQN
jgi:hypothetical protein